MKYKWPKVFLINIIFKILSGNINVFIKSYIFSYQQIQTINKCLNRAIMNSDVLSSLMQFLNK